MKRVLAMLLISLPATASEVPPVSFSREIAPILQAKCFACHSEGKAKGGYRTHTLAAASQAGKSGVPGIVPGKPDESELFQRLITDDLDDRMPLDDQPLPPEQIALIKRWIAEGVILDAGTPDTPLAAFHPVNPHPAPPQVYHVPQPITALAFSPAGDLLAVNGYHEFTLWKLSGELVRRVTNAPARIRALAFHPQASHIVLAGGKSGRAGEVTTYHLASGQLEAILIRTPDEMLSLAFSADGKYLAAGGTDHAIHLFDWDKRTNLTTIRQHADWVTALSFSADGEHLASASRDRTARYYRTRDGQLETTYVLQSAALFAVAAVTPELIASGGRDRAIHLWKPDDGKKRGEINFGSPIHQILPFQGNLFSAAQDGRIRLHRAENRELIRTFEGHTAPVFALALDSSGRQLASGSYDGQVRVWNAQDGTPHATFYPAPGYSQTAR